MILGKRILLVIGGGIAAYKCLDLVRRLREQGATVTGLLTRAGSEFVTPLSVAALSEQPVYSDLFSLKDETEMGHIRLSREADLILVAPATADLMAKMVHGLADDLASAMLLAANRQIMVAPAMNVAMWENPATQANIKCLAGRGVTVLGPNEGDMACGEYGFGRMVEVAEMVAAIENYFAADAPLSGRAALVTSGPTWEPIDPIRFIANRSSGRQGHAIAGALARLGAATTLVSGPTSLAAPDGVELKEIETAAEMMAACEAALPVDVAVCAAAVGDWAVANPANQKIKKDGLSGRASGPRLRIAGKSRYISRNLSGDEDRARAKTASAGRWLCRRDTKAWSIMRSPSAPPRIAIGSSPTTWRRTAGTIGGPDNRGPFDYPSRQHEDWPQDEQARFGHAIGPAYRRRVGSGKRRHDGGGAKRNSGRGPGSGPRRGARPAHICDSPVGGGRSDGRDRRHTDPGAWGPRAGPDGTCRCSAGRTSRRRSVRAPAWPISRGSPYSTARAPSMPIIAARSG